MKYRALFAGIALAGVTCAFQTYAGDIPPEIVTKCAADWGTDYSMQVWCRDEQMNALQKLRAQDAPAQASDSAFNSALVSAAIEEVKGLLKEGGRKRVYSVMKTCFRDMASLSDYQRCDTFKAVLIFYHSDKSGPMAMAPLINLEAQEGRRHFGERSKLSLNWQPAVFGVVLREKKSFP